MEMPNPPAPNPVASGLHCATCNKVYSNISHLRRHEATHTGRRSSSCPTCNKSFARVDVARRHIRRCGDGDGTVLSTAKRGKKRRACDGCAKHKASCDGADPCARCQSRGVGCTYLRRDDATSTSTGHTSPPTTRPEKADAAVSGRIPIKFLLGLVNPAASSVSESINAGIGDDDTQDLAVPLGLRSGYGIPTPEEDTMSWESFVPPNLFAPDFSPESIDDSPVDQQQYAVTGSSSLAARMEDLVQQLSDTHGLMLLNGTTDEARFDLELAKSVFTVENLAYFLCVYFRRIHPSHPIIHRPTFDCETASLPLLLAVFSFGSLYSPPVDCALSARSFLDIAEEFIFSHPTFRRLLNKQDSSRSGLRKQDIEILQAALTIVVAQNGMNVKATRRRIRVDRHPRLNAVLRISGLFAAKHQPPDGADSEADRWEKFARDESCIRVAAWAVINDSFVAGFFNGNPQIFVSEMVGDMSCREALFEAETADDFLRLLSMGPTEPKPPSLATSISSLLMDVWPGPADPTYKRLTPGNLLTIISALGTVAVTARTICLIPASANALLRACWRWKALWDQAAAMEAVDPIEKRGFIKHASEMWWLVATHVKVAASGDLTCRHMHIMATDTTDGMNEFLERYRDG